MPTLTLKTKFLVTAPDVRGANKESDSELSSQINIYLYALGKDYFVGKFPLSIIRTLLGNTPEYRQIVEICNKQGPVDGDIEPVVVDMPSTQFTLWAEKFDQSQTKEIFQLINS